MCRGLGLEGFCWGFVICIEEGGSWLDFFLSWAVCIIWRSLLFGSFCCSAAFCNLHARLDNFGEFMLLSTGDLSCFAVGNAWLIGW